MKIGYLLQAGVPDITARCPSGPANHVIHVCRGLARRGHTVRLIVRLGGTIWKTDDLTSFERVSVPSLDGGLFRLVERVVRRSQSELNLPYLAAFDAVRFAAVCCNELRGSDLLYERMGWMGGAGSIAARLMKIPHVLELNGDHLTEHEMLGFSPSRLQRLCSKVLMRRVARGATHTIATGEGWRRRYIEQWGVDPSSVSVVQNGSEVVDLLERQDLRCFAADATAGRPLELIYVGSFDPWQDLSLLIRTVSRALNAGSNLRLTLAGTGPLKGALENLTRDLNVEAHVTFAGHLSIDKLVDLLREAQVGISLYRGREEFTGLKLLDYKSAGLATIAAGRNGQPTLIKHGVTGIIVPPDDPDALLGAICHFERNPAIMSESGRQARFEAEQQHRWQHTVEAIEQRLFDLLSADCRRRKKVLAA